MAIRGSIESDGIVLKGQIFDLHRAPKSSTTNSLLCCIPDFESDSNIRNNFIPFKNILWVDSIASEESLGATLDGSDFEITYLQENGDKSKGPSLIPKKTIISMDEQTDPSSSSPSSDLTSVIMSKAYTNSQPQKSVLVLVNPHSGQGKALKMYKNEVEPILYSANYKVELIKTQYHEHAIDIARDLDIDKYDVIICASGDGTPHEVINGLYQREDRVAAFNKLIVTQCPCGSGNAMSLSCHDTLDPARATLEIIKGHVVRTDLMAVVNSLGDPVKLSFLSSTYGYIAEADINTEWMRFMGSVRFDIGVAMQVFKVAKFPCSIAVKYVTRTKDELSQFYLSQLDKKLESNEITEDSFNLKYFKQGDDLSSENLNDKSHYQGWEWIDDEITDNLAIFYAGKIPYISKDTNFFPATLPQDGTFDIILTDTRANILKSAEILLQLDKGHHVWNDEVQHSKVEAFRLIPKLPNGRKSVISIDGENFPFVPFQVEVLGGLLKTLMSDGTFVETGFKEKIMENLASRNLERDFNSNSSTNGLLE